MSDDSIIYAEISTGNLVEAVRVTAADFCATADPMFDGCPFSSIPTWLDEALGKVILMYPDDRDYALWKVNGEIAEPGDYIINHQEGSLSVLKGADFKSKYTLLAEA